MADLLALIHPWLNLSSKQTSILLPGAYAVGALPMHTVHAVTNFGLRADVRGPLADESESMNLT